MIRAILRQALLSSLYAIVLGVALGAVAYYAGHTGNHNGATTFGEAVRIGVFFAVVGSVLGVLKACTQAAGTRLRQHRSPR